MNKTVKIILWILLVFVAIIGMLFALGIVTFTQFTTETTTTVETWTVEVPQAYDYESWKEIISEECTYFFDGCNTCSKIPWKKDTAACTMMACEKYEEPKCLDENEIEENMLWQDNDKTEGVKNAENVPTCDPNDPLSQCKLENEDIETMIENGEVPAEIVTFLPREESLERVKIEKLIKITESSSLEVVFETKVETDQGEEYYKYSTQEPQISAYKDLVKSCDPACEEVVIATE